MLRKYYSKAASVASVLRQQNLRLGDRAYRVRPFLLNRIALQRRDYEPWLDPAYRAALSSKRGLFVDIGANIGQTMLKVLSFDRERHYLGFEPQVACCSVIQAFFDDNRLNSHSILPLGLSNRNGVVKLYRRDGADSSASMVASFRPASFYTSHAYICVRRGDELMAELEVPTIATVNLDVEGGELEVIEGLTATLARDKPSIIFEVLNNFLAMTGQTLDAETIAFRMARVAKLEAILRGLGYELYNIRPDRRLRRIERVSPAANGDMSITNYIAVHKDDVSTFSGAFDGSIEAA